MLVIRAGIHQILVRLANSEDPDQTASSVGLDHFGNQLAFKIFNIYRMCIMWLCYQIWYIPSCIPIV